MQCSSRFCCPLKQYFMQNLGRISSLWLKKRNKCKRHFSHLFHLYHGPVVVYIIIAYKHKSSRRENKYYLKTFQIDPLLMFLFLCVKDNLFSNFPFQLNAMFVHGNCHYRIPVNFEGHNFVYEEVIATNHIRWRKIISTLLSCSNTKLNYLLP